MDLDVVVVGSDASGLAAAIEAAQEGARAAVFEKRQFFEFLSPEDVVQSPVL